MALSGKKWDNTGIMYTVKHWWIWGIREIEVPLGPNGKLDAAKWNADWTCYGVYGKPVTLTSAKRQVIRKKHERMATLNRQIDAANSEIARLSAISLDPKPV